MDDNKGITLDAEAMLAGQAEIWSFMVSFADSMALKCAVELRIADIIHSHGHPIALSQIISSIDNAPSPDITCLVARIMRLLVRKNIFSSNTGSDGEEPLYGLTPSSTWLLHEAELSLAPMVLLLNDHRTQAPWHCLSSCLREGGTAFQKAHGCRIFEYSSMDGQFNELLNNGMACSTKITMSAIMSAYKDGFCGMGSVVDVGGGTGSAVAAIVKANPHVKGVNFDLPRVISTAPEYTGVTHVGGDMFKEVPKADAVFMKSVLHDWSDEDCVKILKNCRAALPKETGKMIIVDLVLNPEGQGLFGNTEIVMDVIMMHYTLSGKERTELEWKKVLEEAGFGTYKIIKIPALMSIIEAYPNCS